LAIKSVQDARYRAAIDALREARLAAPLTQVELATALGRSQQFVSKYESFERRLDIVEFIDIATALSIDWRRELTRAINAG
jgi:transcriptional regulator with XRE-family HTH domain